MVLYFLVAVHLKEAFEGGIVLNFKSSRKKYSIMTQLSYGNTQKVLSDDI